MLVRVVASHFVAGIVLTDDKVAQAAPILKYMLGWTRERASAYCKAKAWQAHIVPETQKPALEQKERRP